MNMFHRYQEKDGTGLLWFSMMGLTEKGVRPFDLYNIKEDSFKGIVLFLPLPHPKVFQGFDSMMSIATLIADQLDAHLVDEHGNRVGTEYKKMLRQQLQQTYG